MIIPCIDLMGGKVVQLVQGREKALEGDTPDRMLEKFSAFPVIQVIDLDAAIGSGSNEDLVEHIACRARTRVGGGVRTPEKARRLLDLGAERVIVGTAAFTGNGPDRDFLAELTGTVPAGRVLLALDSKEGRIVVKGWRESLKVSAEEIIRDLEPWCGGFLCTYVDKEGMMQGTDLEWFRRLRAATSHEITAAGGITTIDDIRALDNMQIHSALGMAIYTGRLNLEELATLKQNTFDLQSMNGGVREDRAGEGPVGQNRPRLFVDDGQGDCD
jgi:phosphoribosylformimino-5-aminoimidazole carboxamide ribotide isomerase